MVARTWDDIPTSTFKKLWNKLLKFVEQDKDQGVTDTTSTTQNMSGEVDVTSENDHVAC